MASILKISCLTAVSLTALAASAALADQTPKDTPTRTDDTTEVVIRGHRLDNAQLSIRPNLGASSYQLSRDAVKNMPGGDNVALSQVILQAPGVTQDSFGQLHVRGDHNNIQYRLNGVILPEGLSSFGQVLSPKFAQGVEMDTGALPAEYGLRTAAVINMMTRSVMKTGGTASLYGGSHGQATASLDYGGSKGDDTFFGSLSAMQSQLGIEAPYNVSTPLHDRTHQVLGFGYFEHTLNDNNRLSLIAGASDQTFQLPNTPGLSSASDGAGFAVNGVSDFASDHIDARQREVTDYAIGSWLATSGAFTSQVSLFARYSRLVYTPDIAPELAFNGVAQRADKRDSSTGLQAEGALTLGDKNTLRFGLIASADHTVSKTETWVFDLDGNDDPVSDVPRAIVDNGTKDSQTLSAYVQDEWKPVDGFTLNYGLRYDSLRSYRHEDQLSPRINFVWKPAEGTTIHGGYARYFTPPPYELIASQTQALFTGTSFDISGPNDLPYAQRDNYYDLGVQQRLGSHLTVGIDAYHRVARYLIDEGQFGAPIILTPFNYKYGRNSGVEFTADYQDGPFTGYFNYAVSSAKGREVVSSQFNFDPADLAYVADHFIYVDHNQTTSASLGMTYKVGQTHLSLDALYGSGLRTDGAIPNGARLPDYVTVNAGVSHEFGGGVTARLDVVNLFDQAYEIRDGGGIGVGAPQWGARRGIFIGLSKDF